LHYLDTETFAGTETHLLTLLRALTAQGEICGLVCREDTELAHRARQLPDVAVFALPPLSLGQALRGLGRYISEWRPDLLHAHNGRTSLQCACLSGQGKGRRRPRSILTQHFIDPAHTQYRGIKHAVAVAMHRWTNARLCRIIAVSEAVRRSALSREHLLPEKVVTIYNGIFPPQADSARARAFLGEEARRPLVVTVARLNEEKGHRYLLAAAPEIARVYPTVQFLWLGTGPAESALRAEIEQQGLRNRVRLLGHRTDAADFLALADLKVLPSLAEPFGLALVEAMLLGTPVLATDCGGPQEIVTPAYPAAEATGWLVPPADPEALGRAVCTALADAELRTQVGQCGQARACAEFTAQRMALRTAAVYRDTLQERTTQAPGRI
jgi:glycosyltransferase involved in cell wall biosynthesis